MSPEGELTQHTLLQLPLLEVGQFGLLHHHYTMIHWCVEGEREILLFCFIATFEETHLATSHSALSPFSSSCVSLLKEALGVEKSPPWATGCLLVDVAIVHFATTPLYCLLLPAVFMCTTCLPVAMYGSVAKSICAHVQISLDRGKLKEDSGKSAV